MITWNPNDKSSSITLSQNNLYVDTGSTLGRFVRATHGKSSGKWYWEFTLKNNVDQVGQIGITTKTPNPNTDVRRSNQLRSYLPFNGKKSSTSNEDGSPFAVYSTINNTIGIAMDLDDGNLSFYKDGRLLGIAFTDIDILGEVYPVAINSTTSSRRLVGLANFGATPFEYDIPDGYLPYNVENANWITTQKHLLKSDNNIYTLNETNNGLNNITTSISDINNIRNIEFIDYGFDNINDIMIEKNRKSRLMAYKNSLDDGQVYSVDINRLEFPIINKIEIK